MSAEIPETGSLWYKEDKKGTLTFYEVLLITNQLARVLSKDKEKWPTTVVFRERGSSSRNWSMPLSSFLDNMKFHTGRKRYHKEKL